MTAASAWRFLQGRFLQEPLGHGRVAGTCRGRSCDTKKMAENPQEVQEALQAEGSNFE